MRAYRIDPRVRVGRCSTLVDPAVDEIAGERRKVRVGHVVEVEWFMGGGVRKATAVVEAIHADDEGALVQLLPDWDRLE